MFLRTLLIAGAVGTGFLLATFLPHAADQLRSVLTRVEILAFGRAATGRAEPPPTAPTAPEPRRAPATEATIVKLTDAQIAKAAIRVEAASGGSLARHLAVPGSIVPSANNSARIAVKTTGTVAELRKRLGDKVAKGEVVALLDSREVADAKSEYIAGLVAAELQRTLFEREQSLWTKRISSEQQYLRARASMEDAKVKAEGARRKLTFLGSSPTEIKALPTLPAAQFERQEIRSPIAGRIVERRVDLGAAVGRDNLETELYGVVNLSEVWVDLAVSPGDLPLVREGQTVTVSTQSTGDRATGRIVFIGPVLDRDTRSARVVAEIRNPEEKWRPGSFVAAEIAIVDKPARVLVPHDAIQKIDGRQRVFVRIDGGFEARLVDLGRSDDRVVEVKTGLSPGDMVAVANAFILKAELSKSQAED